jgi:hypothetical protein
MSGKTLGTEGLVLNEPLVFEQGAVGRRAYALPDSGIPDKGLGNCSRAVMFVRRLRAFQRSAK